MPKYRPVCSIGLVVLTSVMACGSAAAKDLIFMSGFGNVTVAISSPPDGTTIGGAEPLFTGAASVTATLDWYNSELGYVGSGDTIFPSLVPGFQRIYLKATTSDPEIAWAECDVTFLGGP